MLILVEECTLALDHYNGISMSFLTAQVKHRQRCAATSQRKSNVIMDVLQHQPSKAVSNTCSNVHEAQFWKPSTFSPAQEV